MQPNAILGKPNFTLLPTKLMLCTNTIQVDGQVVVR